MNKRILAVICVICLCVSCMGAFTGCGKKKLTDAEYEDLAKQKAADNAKKVVFKISKGDKSYDVTLDMFTYYLAYNEADGNDNYNTNIDYYRELFGDTDFWSIVSSTTGQTMGQIYKDQVYSSMMYTLLMYYEALEAGVSMTDNRKSVIDQTTEQFLNRFTAEQRARCGMTADVIRANYERIFLADQFSTIMASNVVIDRDVVAKTVDKEMYRYYKTNYIYLTKSDENEELAKRAGTTEQRQELMKECFEEAQGGADLADIQAKHKEILVYSNRDFRPVDAQGLDVDYINAVLNMKVGDRRMLDLNYGIYILELVDDSTFYGYEDAVTEKVAETQQRGIKEIYENIEAKYTIVKTEEWDAIQLGTYLSAPKK